MIADDDNANALGSGQGHFILNKILNFVFQNGTSACKRKIEPRHLICNQDVEARVMVP